MQTPNQSRRGGPAVAANMLTTIAQLNKSCAVNNEKAPTTNPSFAPHGKGDDNGKILYFVDIRLPNT